MFVLEDDRPSARGAHSGAGLRNGEDLIVGRGRDVEGIGYRVISEPRGSQNQRGSVWLDRITTGDDNGLHLDCAGGSRQIRQTETCYGAIEHVRNENRSGVGMVGDRQIPRTVEFVSNSSCQLAIAID